MDGEVGSKTASVRSFGPFRLFAAERRLEKSGAVVQLGGRAFDILCVLTERAGDVVSKQELLSRVWPGVTVEEGSLRVTINGLRKALDDHPGGTGYVINVAGRGYCFAAAVSSSEAPLDRGTERLALVGRHNLPPLLGRMIGREVAVGTIVNQLADSRFVTIVGPGGIGKTTVAVAVAYALLTDLDGFVRFADLSVLSDATLVPTAVALALEAPAHSDAISSVINFLKGKRGLLILDNCEHVIDTVSGIAERIFAEAPWVNLLVTSREPLNIEGERVHRLSLLDYPLSDVGLTPHAALSFPSIQLFVERVSASGSFELGASDAVTVSGICRKLDGIALAIELAAGRVATYGVSEVANLLDSRLKMLWQGRRTAPPRHQTLNATLDWSYELLSESERATLRSLSVFVGWFTLEAAQAVAGSESIEVTQVFQTVESLVAKSLIAADVDRSTPRYRLLEMTRAYARAKLSDSGEADAATHRHAVYWQDLLERDMADAGEFIKPDKITVYAEHVSDIRAALEACFAPDGDIDVGIRLAAWSHSLFLTLALWDECQRWCELALSALDETTRGTRVEMLLQSSLAISLQARWLRIDASYPAFTRSLQLAEDLDDKPHQLFILSELRAGRHVAGDASGALDVASRGKAVAIAMGDTAQIWLADCALAQAHHVVGNQLAAQRHCEAALAQAAAFSAEEPRHFKDDTLNQTRCALAATLWLRGFPEQAVAVAKQAMAEAEASGNFLLLSHAIMWLSRVFRWSGDWEMASALLERLAEIGRLNSLGAYAAISAGLKGKLLIEMGQSEPGVRVLQELLKAPSSREFENQNLSALALGLASLGDIGEAHAAIDRAIEKESAFGESFSLPEMLRWKAEILVLTPGADPAFTEQWLLRAGDMAKRQSALSWQLRTATSLAMLCKRQGRLNEGRQALDSVYQEFTEGFETPDLVKARNLLDELAQGLRLEG